MVTNEDKWFNKKKFKPLISIALASALIIALLEKGHEKVKFNISEIITIIWLIYSIYYKDYSVMIICIIILMYSLSQTPKEQVIAWP
jgi:hypothetical protein